jgi:hypothetical protein
MYVDPYGTFYTVAGTSIYAIGGDGSVKWVVPVENDWLRNQTDFYLSAADYQGNTLYVVIGSEPARIYYEKSLLMAISDSGKVLWTAPVDGVYNMQMLASAQGIYLQYYPDTLAAYDIHGRLLWYKDTDSYITSMTARNGTIYYQMNGGRFSAAGADITAWVCRSSHLPVLPLFSARGGLPRPVATG